MDIKYMKEAIELGKRGIGKVSPNPPVGAVVVKDGRVIGKGWHEFYGGLHAERNALNGCGENAKGAELYVTLEPCCHYGKTPPCTDIIIEKGIGKVYVGAADPNINVSGRGIKILRKKGIQVETGVLEKECIELAAEFHWFQSTKKPYVILKYAMSADGKTAAESGDSKWISGKKSRKKVHELRSRYDAIMVGIGTVIKDDPMLTSRIENGRDPVRIIVDSHMRISEESNIVQTAKNIRTIVVTAVTDNGDKGKEEFLKNRGIEILKTNEDRGKVDVREMMSLLGEKGITSIMVEGGGELNFSIVEKGLFNKIYCYIAPKLIGGKNGFSPVSGKGFGSVGEAAKLKLLEVSTIENDILAIYEKEEVTDCLQGL